VKGRVLRWSPTRRRGRRGGSKTSRSRRLVTAVSRDYRRSESTGESYRSYRALSTSRRFEEALPKKGSLTGCSYERGARSFSTYYLSEPLVKRNDEASGFDCRHPLAPRSSVRPSLDVFLPTRAAHISAVPSAWSRRSSDHAEQRIHRHATQTAVFVGFGPFRFSLTDSDLVPKIHRE